MVTPSVKHLSSSPLEIGEIVYIVNETYFRNVTVKCQIAVKTVFVG